MTKQQQNDIILAAIGQQIADTPDVQERVALAFKDWFSGLAEQGAQQLASQAQQQQQQGGGDDNAGNAAPQQG